MEERIQNLLKERFGRDIDNCTKSEIFEVLMVLTKQEMASRRRNEGKKKLYYLSLIHIFPVLAMDFCGIILRLEV